MGIRSAEFRARFKQRIVARFVLRFHMTLILSGTFLAGVIASSLLFSAGLASIPLRLALAVVVSYATCVTLIRLWLAYVRGSPGGGRNSSRSSLDATDLLQRHLGSTGGTGSGSSVTGPVFKGGGGRSGAGGASGSWSDKPVSMAAAPSPNAQAAPSSSGNSIDVGGGDDLVVLIVFALLIAVICGAGFYLIYDAPGILAEAALEFALSTGLVRAARRVDQAGWFGSVVANTWIPFAVVLLVSVIVGMVFENRCPRAQRFRDYPEACQKPY